MAAAPRSRTGKFLGMPYNWQRPTRERYRSSYWNPDEPQIITPRPFGWGYAVNFYRLLHRRAK